MTTTFKIRNKRDSKCLTCGKTLAVGQGWSTKNSHGKWFSVCNDARCAEPHGIEGVGVQQTIRRLIQVSALLLGIVMEFDRDALPLLRSLPGARWNPELKQWTCSADAKHRARVLEVADKLQLNVDDELRVLSDPRRDRALARCADTGLYDYQVDGVEFLALHNRALLADDMGLGKAQPLDAAILTPKGWKLMLTIQVGDLVIGSNGQPTPVIGVYPQGKKQIYRVTFSDGASTECCEEHLWNVITPTRKKRGSGYQTLSLRAIMEVGLRDKAGNCKHFIPMVDPVEFNAQALPIDPYVLGALLGDGSIISGTPTITSDAAISEIIAQRLPDGVHVSQLAAHDHCVDFSLSSGRDSNTNPITEALRDLALWGCSSTDKFIPRPYLFGTVAQRRELLAGLLDTDGSAYDNSTIEFSSSSQDLAEDVLHLVRSLGGTATLSSRIPTYTYNGESRTGNRSWRLIITMPNGINPFKLDRKVKALRRQGKYGPTRAIVNVVAIGQKPAQCIRVAAEDNLYVTDDFIVTHNTVQVLMALEPDSRVLVVCPNSVRYVWRDETLKWRPDFTPVVTAGRARAPEAGEIIIVNYTQAPLEKEAANFSDVVLVVDECFPGSTEILTDRGLLKIQDIVENKLQVNAISFNIELKTWEYKPVSRWMRHKRHNSLVKVVHEDGEFTCTSNHKIWTDEGYVAAGSLRCGARLRTLSDNVHDTEKRKINSEVLFQSMRRQEHQFQTGGQGENSRCKQGTGVQARVRRLRDGFHRQNESAKTALLHEVMLVDLQMHQACISGRVESSSQTTSRESWPSNAGEMQFSRIGAHDALKQGPRFPLQGNGSGCQISYGESKFFAARRKAANHNAPANAIRSTWPWVCAGVHNKTRKGTDGSYVHKSGSAKQSAKVLPSGHCAPGVKDGYRGRRKHASVKKVALPGQKEKLRSGSSRVVRIEILERGNTSGSGICSQDDFVYNLEVADNHNYVADGVLVSNCHFVKNYKSARTKKITAVAKVSSTTWLLTGTPLANRPFDLWGTLNAGGLAWEVFGKFDRFVTLFGGHKNRWGGWDFAPKPLPEAAERMRRVMLRRRKDDVLTSLPTKRYQHILVNDISKGLRQQLDALEDVSDAFLSAGELPPFEMFSSLRADLASEKIPALIELVESYEEADEPIVVFSAHRAPVEALGAREGWGMIIGSMTPEDRANVVRDFQSGKLKGVALTIAAGAEGLTLTHASRMIFVDLPWVPGTLLQAEDRIRRIGQTASSLEYIRLVVDHSLEKRVYDLLDQKKRLIEGAIEAEVSYTPPPPPVKVMAESDAEWQARVDAHQAKLAKAESERQQKAAEAERKAHQTFVDRICEQEQARVSNGSQKPLKAPERISDPEYRQLLIRAHEDMLNHCDGAIEKDGVGFNKPDAVRAVVLCRYNLDTAAAAEALWFLLYRYRRQLSDRGFAAIYA